MTAVTAVAKERNVVGRARHGHHQDDTVHATSRVRNSSPTLERTADARAIRFAPSARTERLFHVDTEYIPRSFDLVSGV
jgi:hypothetical protein